MSPTASRSVSSSHSHDRDPFSSHSKGSVASSGDDDLDSPQSISMSSLDRSTPKSIGAFPNNRALGFSKKPSRILSSSSAPKRSFDLALQQMVSTFLVSVIMTSFLIAIIYCLVTLVVYCSLSLG